MAKAKSEFFKKHSPVKVGVVAVIVLAVIFGVIYAYKKRKSNKGGADTDTPDSNVNETGKENPLPVADDKRVVVDTIAGRASVTTK